MEKWFLIRKGGDYTALGKKYGISPVAARIMKNRGISTEEEARAFLSVGAAGLFDGEQMADCRKAVAVLKQKIEEKKKIRVIGDYDIDGVTSTFILVKGLRKTGADADHCIPHRVKDGYGLNENLIREAHADGIDTILTCDNGISAAPQIELANSLGMTVVVTDHHEIPFHMEGDTRVEDLPPAAAVVDPHRSDCPYPYKMLCGAAVAWKVLQVLYREMGIPASEAEEFLEIAAFATIGDVMPLTGENRTLVREGLKRLKDTKNKGMRALIDLSGLAGKILEPYHVGFVLGPCLNAAGRLDTAEDALTLLLSEEDHVAHDKAVILKEMNESRKSLTEKGVEAASELASDPEHESDRVLVIYLHDCHESIVGIIAGKIRERFSKPVFVLTEGQLSDGTPCLKGSGRSIEAYNMYEEMIGIRDVFLQFGGHAMAAGLSIAPERLEEFRKRLNENTVLTEEDLMPRVHIDMELPFRYASLDLVDDLKILEPYGTGNEKPLFAARNVTLENMRVFGKSRNVLKGTAVDESGVRQDVVYFGAADEMEQYIRERGKVAVTYNPDRNEFGGNVTLQLILKNVR
ncbi:single-stranded-DNA-specific exonuclease [Lachnospiraceae bacterium]|nr:single-stranded-DNA-specific exonuclease [Lachnospiraceae bacterium]